MLGFYVAMGALLALAVGFCFAWTPLRIWYWQGEVRRRGPCGTTTLTRTPSGVHISRTPRGDAARELVRIGPRASPALKRLLQEGGDDRLRYDVLSGIKGEDAPWVVPLLIDVLKGSEYAETRLTVQIMELFAGRQFIPRPAYSRILSLIGDSWNENERVEEGRKSALDWWEREGKAKYGGIEQ
jgi:hypothetical protein